MGDVLVPLRLHKKRNVTIRRGVSGAGNSSFDKLADRRSGSREDVIAAGYNANPFRINLTTAFTACNHELHSTGSKYAQLRYKST